jgi:hypothetical protein
MNIPDGYTHRVVAERSERNKKLPQVFLCRAFMVAHITRTVRIPGQWCKFGTRAHQSSGGPKAKIEAPKNAANLPK